MEEHCCNNTNRGKQNYLKINLFLCHFVHHKSQTDWPETSVVRGQRLTVRAMVWSLLFYHKACFSSKTPICLKCYVILCNFIINLENLSFLFISICYIQFVYIVFGLGGGAVGSALQVIRLRVRFPMGPLECFINFLPSFLTVAPGWTQPLTDMSTRSIFCGVKAADT